MSRLISITDDQRRDAQVEFNPPAKAKGAHLAGPIRDGKRVNVEMQRLLKSTEAGTYSVLLKKCGTPEGISQALIAGDPELDAEQVGRPLTHAMRVHMRDDGSVVFAARSLLVTYGPDGAEKTRADFVDVEPSIGEEAPPVLWSGKLLTAADVVKRFAIVRQVQLRHVNGLTYDFLFTMAKTLQAAGKLLLVGAGAKGNQPLIFNVNGAPYRGFLQGSIDGDGYTLILHLSNLELKVPAPVAEKAAP